jgi:hypothetical protein
VIISGCLRHTVAQDGVAMRKGAGVRQLTESFVGTNVAEVPKVVIHLTILTARECWTSCRSPCFLSAPDPDSA